MCALREECVSSQGLLLGTMPENRHTYFPTIYYPQSFSLMEKLRVGDSELLAIAEGRSLGRRPLPSLSSMQSPQVDALIYQASMVGIHSTE